MASCNESYEFERIGRFLCCPFLAGSAHRSGNERCDIVHSIWTSTGSVERSCSDMGASRSALPGFRCLAELIHGSCSQRHCVGFRPAAHRFPSDLWQRGARPNDLYSLDEGVAGHWLCDPEPRMEVL